MRIPAQAKVVGPHVGRTAVDQHEQGVTAGRVESWRQRVEAVNAVAAGCCKPELAQRLPVDCLGPVRVELRQRGPAAGGRIDPDDFGRIGRTLPHRRHLHGAPRGRRRHLQTTERAARHLADLLLQPFGCGRAKQARVAGVLSEEKHAAPIRRRVVAADRMLGPSGDDTRSDIRAVRPGPRHQPPVVERVLVGRRHDGVQCLAIRAELRSVVIVFALRKP